MFIGRLGSIELDVLKGKPRFSSFYQVPRFVPFVRMCVCVRVCLLLCVWKLSLSKYKAGSALQTEKFDSSKPFLNSYFRHRKALETRPIQLAMPLR